MQTTRRRFIGIGLALTVARTRLARAQTPRIETIAGTGTAGVAAAGDAADMALIDDPYGLTEDPAGTGLYFVDNGSHRVLGLDYASGTIVVVAGTGTAGYSGDGMPGPLAQLAQPHELRFDSRGDLYVADRDNHVVRRIDMRTGLISTVAGTPGVRGFAGDGGPAAQAQFNQPHGIAFDPDDNMYVCDLLNHRVRRIDAATGVIETFAGNGATGRAPDQGPLLETAIEGPRAIECSRAGKVYVALREGNSIFELDGETGRMTRVAGTGENGYTGDGGPATAATFGALAPGGLTGPKGLCVSEDGNLMYVADCENHVIRRIDLPSGIITTVAGTGTAGDGMDGDPLQCQLSRPHAVFVRGGVLYLTDSSNHRIRRLTPA